jgi:hypothetical protein
MRVGCLGIVVGFLVLVLLGLGIADRVAAGIAEERLAEEVALAARRENAQAAGTTAEIDGYPFLTQVWSGEYEGGRIGLQRLRTEQLTIANVDIEVTRLTVPRDVLFGAEPHDINAAKMDGSATVSLAELASRLGLPGLRITGDGSRLAFTAPISFAGFTATVQGDADIRLDGRRVWLEVGSLSANGVTAPPQVLSLVRQQLAAGVTIPALPYELRLTGVAVNGDTVRVRAVADNVPLVQ